MQVWSHGEWLSKPKHIWLYDCYGEEVAAARDKDVVELALEEMVDWYENLLVFHVARELKRCQ